MSSIRFRDNLKLVFYLNRVQANRSLEHLERCRYWLDKALAIKGDEDINALAVAADGLQKINENRLTEAWSAFGTCKDVLISPKSDDERYTLAFCQLWIEIGNHHSGFDSIKQAGSEAHMARESASRFFRGLLPLPSRDRLTEVCGDRKPPSSMSSQSAESEGSVAKVIFDF